jgi:phosphotransferase system  glucose/maltose/N-acetylglucosamine-specific IIC component
MIIDRACVAWGRTCTSRGNCWIYDGEALRTWFFYISGAAVAMGTFFDFLVYLNAKNLKIFDDEDKKKENDEKKTVKETYKTIDSEKQ